MIQYLEDLKGTGSAPISGEDREQLDRLRREHARLKDKIKTKAKGNKDDYSDDSADSSEVSHYLNREYGSNKCSLILYLG